MNKIVCIAIKHPTEPNLFLHGLRQDNKKWALAGGHAIPGETEHESASRELEEETGLKGVKLDKIHEKIYGNKHVILFSGKTPENFELSSKSDPDKEFVTFKWLDPSNHGNLHIPKERNILLDWLQSISKSEDLAKGLKGDWQKEGYQIGHTKNGLFTPKGGISIHATDNKGNAVAHAHFKVQGKNLIPHEPFIDENAVEVDKKHRRKGIASAMYAHAEKVTGKKIKPSATQTEDGDGLWSQPNRLFGKSLQKAIPLEDLKSQGYKFRIFNPTKNREAFAVATYHKGKRVGHVLYDTRSQIGSKEPHKQGFHQVSTGHVEEPHRGKGLYQHMLNIAADHVKTIGGKGLMSEGFQRSPDATRAWDKVASFANAPNESTSIKPLPYGADYFLQKSKKYYHITDNPNFKPDPNYAPEDNSISKGLKGDWQKEGYSFDYQHNKDIDQHRITAKDKTGNSVGSFIFESGKNGYMATFSKVHKDHQRKGIASAAYKMFEFKTGQKLTPHIGRHDEDKQSPDAQALWSQPNRTFGKSEELNKDQAVIKFPKVPDLPTRLDQELRHVPSGRTKAATRQKEIITRSAIEKLRHAKKTRGLGSEVSDKYVKMVRSNISAVGEAQKRSKANKSSNPGFVSTPTTTTQPKPFYEASQGVVSKDYVLAGKGHSVPEHEAAHLLMTKVAEKYGPVAQRKIIDHFLAHFHPEDRNAMTLALTGGRNRGYKTYDSHLQEEIMNHFRDYLVDSDRRQYIDKWATRNNTKLDSTRVKSGWKNATKYIRNITPDWLRSPDSEVNQIKEKAKDLRPSINQNTEPLAASEDFKKAINQITVEPFTAEPESFNPKIHDFIVRMKKGKKDIGWMAIAHHQNGIMPFNFEVKEKFRRQGFGTALARHAQKISGKKLLPSPDMTPHGQAFAESFFGKQLKKSDPAKIANNTILMYPVSLGGKRLKSNGIPLHMTIKSFGDSDKLDHKSIQNTIDQHKLEEVIDPSRMLFSPHKLKGLDGTEHHVLLAYGAPAKIEQVRQSTQDLGPSFKNFLPHISIDKEDWEDLSSRGTSFTAKDLGLQFHPAELRAGNTVLKTY